ncbi:DUF4124 domain-containing protein [Undibacterium sp.]|uniref:DUF4124 domain-containing protein n=1 Tax=Undibacterium sp. TaxID=1914977 RepID=UPI0025EAAC62|nr:DUF4124 domain-containing protein [Undibacterium sp.]
MPNILKTILASLLALMLSANAVAQVNKCKDLKTGHITYSDAACPKSDAATEISGARSSEELSAERKRASEAQEQTALRFQREAQATQIQAVSSSPARGRPSATAVDPSKSYECSTAKYALEVAKNRATPLKGGTDSYQDQVDMACLGPDAAAKIIAARAGATKIIINNAPRCRLASQELTSSERDACALNEGNQLNR